MPKFGHVPTDTAPLTVRQAATTLGVHVRTVHRLIHAGHLTTVGKLDGATGAWLIDPDDLAAYMGRGTP